MPTTSLGHPQNYTLERDRLMGPCRVIERERAKGKSEGYFAKCGLICSFNIMKQFIKKSVQLRKNFIGGSK